MFNVGDYAVCPGHGVGRICAIEECHEEGDVTTAFYKVEIIANGMTVMVPVSSADGIRKLVGDDEIESVYDLLSDHNVEIDNITWNRRYREYMAKVKTGSLLEIAEVLRSLFLLKRRKSLSFGEKKMLDQCRELLAQEISITAGELGPNKVKTKIDSFFDKRA